MGAYEKTNPAPAGTSVQPLRVLYICYGSIRDPLIQHQVIAYLSGLARLGHCIHLLTFEAPAMGQEEVTDLRRQLQTHQLSWHYLRYHQRPTLPATTFDVCCGVAAARRIIRRHHLQAVHARSHVAATMGLLLKKLMGCRLIFDVRGLLAEEYEDAGRWRRNGLPFRITKAMERRCLAAADGIVVLTQRLHDHLHDYLPGPDSDARVHVIPCCADLAGIETQAGEREAMRAALGLENKTVMAYAGKFGTWYLQAEMAAFFATLRRNLPNLHFLIITQSEPQLMVREMEHHNIPEAGYTITQTSSERIGAYLAAADLAISFIKPCPSKIASSPTKIGEYWAAGLPVICNRGIGDIDAIVEQEHVGVLLSDFSTASYQAALEHVLLLVGPDAIGRDEIQQRCRQTAQRHLSLQALGVPRYHRLYHEIVESLKMARGNEDTMSVDKAMAENTE